MSENTVSRRKFLQWSTMAAAGAVLAACAPKAAPTAAPAATTGVKATAPAAAAATALSKPVTLTWWSYGLGLPATDWPHGKWEGELAARYTKEVDSKVTIEYQPLGWEMIEKTNLAISSGNPPNLIGRGSVGHSTLALKAGVAIEVELEQDLKDDLPAGWEEGMKYGGKLYQVPWYGMCQGPLVNMTIVKEAKAEDLLPKNQCDPWTYDQWLELMKKCTFKRADGSQVYGTAFWNSTTVNAYNWPYLVFMWNWGASYADWNKDKKQWDYPITDDKMVSWLKAMQDLYHVHKVIPDPRAVDSAKVGDYWAANSAAWAMPGPSIGNSRASDVKLDMNTLTVTAAQGFEWRYIQNPTANGTKHTTWGGPALDVNNHLFKTADAATIQPSIKFAHWVVNKPNQTWLAKYQIPIRASAVAAMADDKLLAWMYKCWLPNARTRSGTGCATPECDVFVKAWQKLFLPTDPKKVAEEWLADEKAIKDCWVSGA